MITIKLAEEYQVAALDAAQLSEVLAIFHKEPRRAPFRVIHLAFEGATPPKSRAEVDEIACPIGEIAAAAKEIVDRSVAAISFAPAMTIEVLGRRWVV